MPFGIGSAIKDFVGGNEGAILGTILGGPLGGLIGYGIDEQRRASDEYEEFLASEQARARQQLEESRREAIARRRAALESGRDLPTLRLQTQREGRRTVGLQDLQVALRPNVNLTTSGTSLNIP